LRVSGQTDSSDEPSKPIRFYGTQWCGDCRRAKRVFAEMGLPYLWIDIDSSPAGERFVREVNHGNRSVPTLVFPDGSTLTEPSEQDLRKKLESFRPGF